MKNIHAMAIQGNNGICLESQSLPLYGVVTGLLIAFSSTVADFFATQVISSAYFELFLSATCLLIVALFDRVISKWKRRKRNQLVSLLHQKVNHILVAVIGLAFLLSIYLLLNFGAGKLALWHLLLVFGVCLFVIGQFSTPWYTLNAIIIIGFSIVALLLPQDDTIRFMTVSLFICGGIGIQLFSRLAKSKLTRVMYSLAWLCVAVSSGYIASTIHDTIYSQKNSRQISLNQLQDISNHEKIALQLPKGTAVIIHTKLEIDAFTDSYMNTFTNHLSRDLEIEMQNRRPTGMFRIDAAWTSVEENPFMNSYQATNILTPDLGPRIKRHHTLMLNPEILD